MKVYGADETNFRIMRGFLHDTGASVRITGLDNYNTGICIEWVIALFSVPYPLDTVKQRGGLLLVPTLSALSLDIDMRMLLLVLVLFAPSIPFACALTFCLLPTTVMSIPVIVKNDTVIVFCFAANKK